MDEFLKNLVDVPKPDMSEVKDYEEAYELYNYMPVINDMLPVTSTFQKYLEKYPKNHVFKVPANYKNRIDLISRELYGTSHLWWFLCLYNNIINPDNFDLTEIYYIPKTDLMIIFDEFKGKYGAMNKVEKDLINLIG